MDGCRQTLHLEHRASGKHRDVTGQGEWMGVVGASIAGEGALLLERSQRRDALLGQRTQVKSANDRYANLETDYLLQRLENYQGIVVITTNASEHIDDAFQRRMDVVVTFIPPQAQERWRIWQLHLPAHHRIDHAYLEEA